MAKAIINISGEVADFTRLDDLYKNIKREGAKLLKDWVLSISVEYIEKQGEKV